MTGVEVLATEEVVTKTTCNWWLAGFVFLSVVILAGIVSFCCIDYFDKVLSTLIGCLLGGLIGIFCWVIAGVVTTIPAAYETEHKVIISDDVLMNDFLERYEIVDQDGKIYTVRERND